MKKATIGDRIREARKAHGLSQSDLARRINVSQPSIANWEGGAHDPRRLMVARLSDCLGVPQQWLAEGERSPLEADKQAAAAYLRRPLQHAPVISPSAIADVVANGADPHRHAEDYLPITAAADAQLFAFFSDDEEIAGVFEIGCLIVVDYSDCELAENAYCLAVRAGAPRIRRSFLNPPRLETMPARGSPRAALIDEQTQITGRVRFAIRFY